MRADAGVTTNGSTVSAWADQSGNSTDFIQTTSDYQPLYVTNSINGRPALSFGTNDNMTTVLGIPYEETSSVTVYTVERVIASAGWTAVWDTEGEGGARGRGFEDDTFFIIQNYDTSEEGGTLTNVGPAINTVRIVGVSYTPTYFFAFINGTNYAFEGPDTSGSTNGIRIGGGYTGGNYPAIDFAEILVYTNAISVADRAQLENYLNAKYNIYAQKAPAPKISPIGGRSAHAQRWQESGHAVDL